MLKKSYFKNFKKKMIGFVVAFGLLASAFTGLSINSNKKADAYYAESTKYISDPSFTSYSGSSPLKPSQWTMVEEDRYYDSNSMVGAIINSKSPTSSYLKKYKV